MPPLFAIKPSTSAGQGVFAKEAILPGTTILRDRILLQVSVGGDSRASEKDFLVALNSLPRDDILRFLTLHEGHRAYSCRAFRIFKANAFGDEHHSVIYELASRINHSCVPNAELEDCPEDSGDVEVIAVKPIAQDEEVFITYNPRFVALPRKHRAAVLRLYYGFACRCTACTLPPHEQMLSDMRRRLIGALQQAFQGREPEDEAYYRMLDTLDQQAAERLQVLNGNPTTPLAYPLTPKQETAYKLLSARLLEAEGCFSEQIPEAYCSAAYGLLVQMDKDQKLLVIPAARNVEAWMKRAIEVMETIRGKDSTQAKELRERWAMWSQGSQMDLALTMFRNGAPLDNVFALKVDETIPDDDPDGPVRLKISKLTEEQCDRWVKQHGGGF